MRNPAIHQKLAEGLEHGSEAQFPGSPTLKAEDVKQSQSGLTERRGAQVADPRLSTR
jgi:hypothetical protein